MVIIRPIIERTCFIRCTDRFTSMKKNDYMRNCRQTSRHTTVVVSLLVGLLLFAGCATMPVDEDSDGMAKKLAMLVYPPFDGVKKRIAVTGFENKVSTLTSGGSGQIGVGLAEMLTSELIKTGRFILVERAALSDIVKEQELGQTGLVRKETAAAVGELLGAQLLIMGAVTEFESQSSGGGGGVGYKGFALAARTESAHVGVDVRLVDSSTGQVLKSFNADAKAQAVGLGFTGTIEGVQFGSDAFVKTPLGQAAREAIHKAVMFIINEMEETPWIGRVAQVKDGQIYVNAGATANLKSGMALAAY